MRKGFIATALSLALVITSLGASVLEVNATPLTETVLEASDDGLSVNEEKADEMVTSVSVCEEDSSIVILNADKDNATIELRISKESKTGELVFTKHAGDRDAVITCEINGDLSAEALAFNNKSELDEAEFATMSCEANSLLVEAVSFWKDELAASDISLAELGLEKIYSASDKVAEENEVAGNDEVIEDATGARETFANEDAADGEKETLVADTGTEDESASDIEATTEDAASATDEVTGNDETTVETEMASRTELSSETETTEAEETEELQLETAMPAPTVERIEANYESLTLNVGESAYLSAKLYPENVSATVEYEAVPHNSTDMGAITVNKYSGKVTANYVPLFGLEVKVKAGSVEKVIPVTINSILVDAAHKTDENGNTIESTNSIGKRIIIADGIWVGGFKKEGFTYTGKPITQDIAVYDKEKPLTLNKDYTLTYKNNTNACDDKQINSPSVTITMKGQYSGKRTLYYTIDRQNMMSVENNSKYAAFTYNKKEQKLTPFLIYNDKKLVANKDYKLTYLSTDLVGSATGRTAVMYQLEGIGNFQSMAYGEYYITGAATNNITKATVSYKNSVKYYGPDSADGPSIEDQLELKIKMPGSSTFEDPRTDTTNYDCSVIYDPTKSNVGRIIIAGRSAERSGRIEKTFKITWANDISKVAEVNSHFRTFHQFYDDEDLNKQISQKLLSLKADGTELVEDTDYTVSYSNHNKVGTAKATFKGIGKYSGTIVKTYKLTNDTPSMKVTVDNAEYLQGGARPQIKVEQQLPDPWGMYLDMELKEKTDYIVSYINCNSVGTGKVKITFKGNYAKQKPIEKTFTISKTDISNCNVTAADKAYTGKADSYKSTPVVTASNGKKLVAGKDYEKTYEYLYNDSDVTNNPSAGTVVMVKVTGIGNYKGTASGSYILYDSKERVFNKNFYISVDPKIYTGRPVELDLTTDVHVYASAADMKNGVNELIPAPSFVRVISYKNNVKAGTATVVFGNCYSGSYLYGGTKSVTFKILKKNYDYNKVSAITLSDTAMTLTSTNAKATGSLTATITTVTGIAADNPNLVWKSSNPKVVSISASGNTCNLTAEGNGTSIITCTAQDGSVVARCTVKSVMPKPIP